MTAFMLLLAAVILVLLAAALWADYRRSRVEARLAKLARSGEEREPVRFARAVAFLEQVSRLLTRRKDREELRRKMDAAGYHQEWQLSAFQCVTAALVLFALVAGWFIFEVDLKTVLSKPLPVFKYLLMVFICGRLPEWWLRGQIALNRDKIVASVPQAVDFMTICLESGMGLEDAFNKVGEEMRTSAPEVAAEMRLTRSEMLMLDRTRALMRLKKRTGVRELENLADALLQSIRFGTPLVDTLQTISKEGRQNQISEMEEKAGKISAQVGLPLILFILFPLIVLLVAPAAMAFLRSL